MSTDTHRRVSIYFNLSTPYFFSTDLKDTYAEIKTPLVISKIKDYDPMRDYDLSSPMHYWLQVKNKKDTPFTISYIHSQSQQPNNYMIIIISLALINICDIIVTLINHNIILFCAEMPCAR